MQRIDGPTRAAALTAPAATGAGNSSPGYFSDGDPLSGTPPTTVPADWFNMIQEEQMAILAAAGIAPDKANRGQVLQALRLLFVVAANGGSGTPAPSGSVLAPTGHRISADGYLEQWGYVPGALGSETTVNIVFPIPFPNECFDVVGRVINSSASATGDTQLQEVSLSPNGATLFVQDQSSTFSDAQGGFRWFARGH